MTRYRAAGALRRIALDALTLIYHRASGITHIVDAPVPEILAALADEALDLDELIARLGSDFDLAAEDALAATLAARLHELAAAGLVERV